LSNEAEPIFISADACDDLKLKDSAKAAENRAVDKASLAAIKMSGFIQEKHPDLSSDILDMISYRIIDEYMLNTNHEITFKDDSRICVKLTSTVLITKEELEELIAEYKKIKQPKADVKDVAAEVKENTSFKPQNLEQKKLLYIKKLELWNGEETDHYNELLKNLFLESKYYFLTDDIEIADYIILPQLIRAEVDEIDISNHKMQMQVRFRVSASRDADFEPFDEQQTHFILFAADKDEQEIADSLIQKLLTKAAEKTKIHTENALSELLEKQALQKVKN